MKRPEDGAWDGKKQEQYRNERKGIVTGKLGFPVTIFYAHQSGLFVWLL